MGEIGANQTFPIKNLHRVPSYHAAHTDSLLLAIARASASNPRVLVLDEATSHVGAVDGEMLYHFDNVPFCPR